MRTARHAYLLQLKRRQFVMHDLLVLGAVRDRIDGSGGWPECANQSRLIFENEETLVLFFSFVHQCLGLPCWDIRVFDLFEIEYFCFRISNISNKWKILML
ncbi:hypothetical protein Y032_0050g1975 [Ancylostoma ceylanicum]|uniref:Uncharacterized protein n=1 Tax=Ancylostoma ceylanicum TaxID=53326 RepID=A0A016UAH9_9BILA|nr:hypothetical protein Y032_0050g1975 [Ancylostoma ceylanicum]